MVGGPVSKRRRRPATQRKFPRTARLSAIFQELAAGYFERLNDERIGLLTVTGVDVDSDLNRATVYYSAFEDDPELQEILEDHRKPLRRVIASEARIRKTPEVRFAPDHGIVAGARLEQLLGDIEVTASPETVVADDGAAPPDGDA